MSERQLWRMRRVISSLHNAGVEGGRAENMPKGHDSRVLPPALTPPHAACLVSAADTRNSSQTTEDATISDKIDETDCEGLQAYLSRLSQYRR
jgi:hypothetical protein